MENSFYYFYSATPQVLGGILALFGVFVIFKIQTLKSELVSIGNALQNRVTYLNSYHRLFKEKEEYSSDFLIQSIIEKTLQESNIDKLFEFISSIRNSDRKYDKDLLFDCFRFSCKYNFLRYLINRTIIASYITAGLIVYCLSLIPFGNLIISHTCILVTLFILTILGIAISFYFLLLILIKSIDTVDELEKFSAFD